MFNISGIIVTLCIISTAMSASISTEKLTASINEVQKRFTAVPTDKRIIDSGGSGGHKSDANELQMSDQSNEPEPPVSSDIEQATPKTKEKQRNDKMFDFYRYYAPSPAATAANAAVAPFPYYPYYNPYYQQPYVSAFYSPYYSAGSIVDPSQTADEYDEEYPESNDVDGGVETDEDGSRANNKRRPGGGKNSPIFYIRLPPTPYMFVPGMGYISQPPTIQPLTPQYPINPFINLPITYLSNAKPTGVFPWAQQPPSNFASPQFPSYLPPRPQKPYRPKPQINGTPTPTQDSKITHLGQYLFNGRPEGIYLMSPPPPPYPNPYASPYAIPNPYHQPSAPPPYNPYSAPPYNPYSAPPYNPYSYSPY